MRILDELAKLHEGLTINQDFAYDDFTVNWSDSASKDIF